MRRIDAVKEFVLEIGRIGKTENAISYEAKEVESAALHR